MRRFLLLVIILLSGISVLCAQTVTLDFTTNGWGLPYNSKKGTEARSFTDGTYTIVLEAGAGYYYNEDGYLLFGKKNATLTLPAFDFDVEKIEVVGRKGASPNTLENIYVGDVAVSAECTGTTGTNTFEIAPEYQDAGNVYIIKVNSGHNAQITYIKVYSAGDGGNGGGEESEEDTPTDEEPEEDENTEEDNTEEDNTGDDNTTEEGVETFTLVTSTNQVTEGKVIIASDNLAATGLTQNYGYLPYTEITISAENSAMTTIDNAFELEATQGGYYIKDNYGKYIYLKGTYNSFNVSESIPTEGEVWDIAITDEGTAIITNVEKGKFIQYSPQHITFGCYNVWQEGRIVPHLYLKKSDDAGNGGSQGTTIYYDAIAGKRGREIKTVLEEAFNEHTVRTYSQLWTDFYTTDCRADGKVWDMYSNTTNYVFGDDQSKGADSGEGSSYNREHSFPKSWFGGEVYPMYTDLFHLYPTDSYINQMRSNYPFGEVGSVKKQSQGGHSKLGTSGVSGYSGTVFEPADEYKGDFARTYFYMVTRYESQVASWNSEMLNGSTYPAFTNWAISMLLKWHREDPVSEKEIKRNEAVYSIQNNRNPYIDYPVLAEFIWGELTDVDVDISKLVLHSNNYDTTDTMIETIHSIKEATDIFDLTGRIVNEPAKGIYIINGKKTYIE